MKRYVLVVVIASIFCIIFSGQDSAPLLKIDSFPEFFEKVHIGMKDEEILKIFNYSFKIVLLRDKIISEFPNYQIYKDNDIFDSIEYKKSKFGISFFFIKIYYFKLEWQSIIKLIKIII